MATIAFIGLGMMGSQMAARLRASGHDLRVWNRTPEKARAWSANGGAHCDSPQQAAEGASEAHLMLADDDAVEASTFGPQGLLRGLKPGALIVDHSTVSVAGSKQRAGSLAHEGWQFLQAPVLAGPAQVASGDGVMLVGGEQKVFNRAETTLKGIILLQLWLGEKAEDAAAFKLMANSMLVSITEALAEYFAIAKASGIEPKRALSLFESFDPGRTIKIRGPRMAEADYKAAFTLAMALKDVGLMLQAAGDDARVPALTAIQKKMQRLLEQGFAGLDLGVLNADTVPPSSGAGG